MADQKPSKIKTRSTFRSKLVLLAAPPIVALLMALIWSSDLVVGLENVTIDQRLRLRAAHDPPHDPQIVLVGIGEFTLEKVGRWHDWTRDKDAQFLNALQLRPPSIVAFDFFYPEKSKDPQHDLAFSDALAAHPGAITGLEISPDQIAPLSDLQKQALSSIAPLPNVSGDRFNILGGDHANTPIPLIAESSHTGSVNFPPSNLDGMRRKIPLVVRLANKIYPSLVVQILIQKEKVSPDEVIVALGENITIPKADGGKWVIPIDERGFHYVNYRDTQRFEIIDYIALFLQIARSEEGAPWPAELPAIEDQIMIIGQSASGLSDLGPTPYRAIDPLFAVQATVLDSILREDYLTQYPRWVILLAWTLLAWATLFILRKAHIVVAITVPTLITALFVIAAFGIFQHASILLPIVLPVAGFIATHTTMIGNRLAVELREKRYIRWVFGSYVSPSIVHQIISSGQTPKLGGEKVDITVLFSDIQGFSTFAEELDPESLVELMVEYLSSMTDIITDAGGTLDKYIGDAIDSMFGAPLPIDGHPYTAIRAAIQMQRKQIELDKIWQQQDRPEIVKQMRTRIGLNTGAAVVGNIGSKRRFNYTMMGDNINLGARCESAAKIYGVYTIATESTYKGAREVKDDIVYRYLDQIIVKGRTNPVKIYEVLEERDRVSEDALSCIDLYEAGFQAYLKQDWEKALALFEQSSALEPHQPGRDHGIKTNPSRLMIARCEELSQIPLGTDWNGVYRMTTK